MTQRERINEDGGQEHVDVYNNTPQPVRGQVGSTEQVVRGAPAHVEHHSDRPTVVQPVHTQQSAPTYQNTAGDIDIDLHTPTDRVRWGSIIAGLFAALSTLAVLSLLGLAIGASTYDTGDRARDYGIGAGIWGGLSALLAFALGGWLAGRTAALRGPRNGMLNGAMVWALAVPLLLYLLSSGIGSALRTAGNVAATGAQSAAATTDGNVDASGAQAQADNLQNQAQALNTPENRAQAADTAGRGALGTFGSLLLALGAASLGGYFGGQALADRRRVPAMAGRGGLGGLFR